MTIILDSDTRIYRVHNAEIIAAVSRELAQVDKAQAIRFARYALDLRISEATAFVERTLAKTPSPIAP